MEFIIHHNNRDIGPYSESEVRSRLNSGAITLDDLAWHEGASDRAPLSSYPQFAGAITPDTSSGPALGVPPPLPPVSPIQPLGAYTAATLQAGERPLHKTSLHWMVLLGPALGSLFSLIVIVPLAMIASWKSYYLVWLLLVIPVAIIGAAALAVKTSELVITDRRVLIKVGFIRRQTFEMFISKIESVAVAQGMIGRMLNYGTVEIRGTGGSSEAFTTITAPLKFRDAIQLVQSNAERR